MRGKKEIRKLNRDVLVNAWTVTIPYACQTRGTVVSPIFSLERDEIIA